MAAPKGNQFWKMRSTHGVSPKFKDDEELWDACSQYFEYVDSNPWEEPPATKADGAASLASKPRKVPYTLTGLQLFIDVSHTAWLEWRAEREDLFETIKRVEQIIYQDKFVGATLDFYNANIISRDLGLADKQEHKVNAISDEVREWLGEA